MMHVTWKGMTQRNLTRNRRPAGSPHAATMKHDSRVAMRINIELKRGHALGGAVLSAPPPAINPVAVARVDHRAVAQLGLDVDSK